MKLKEDERILFDDLVSNIKTYTPSLDIADRIINKLNDLVELIINNDSNEKYDDWNF